MKSLPLLPFGVAVLFLSMVVSSGASQLEVHSTRFACITCHVTTPGVGDNLETTPLVLPRPDLCQTCHGDTHGGGE